MLSVCRVTSFLITFTFSPANRGFCTSESLGKSCGACVREHRSGKFGGFTSAYRVHRLVYFECFDWVESAIRREKQLNRWRREKKIALIERNNPTWKDLSAEWDKPVCLKVRTVENSRSLRSD